MEMFNTFKHKEFARSFVINQKTGKYFLLLVYLGLFLSFTEQLNLCRSNVK